MHVCMYQVQQLTVLKDIVLVLGESHTHRTSYKCTVHMHGHAVAGAHWIMKSKFKDTALLRFSNHDTCISETDGHST